MLRTLGVVQACFKDEETRAKAARRLRGKAILEWVVRRVTDAMRLSGVIVVTDNSQENAFIRGTVPADVPVFTGRQSDNLGRVAAALEEYRAEAAVFVRADTPFIDPGLIDRLINTAQLHDDCDIVSYCSHDGRPAILSPVGVYAEWCKVSTLWKANRLARTEPERREVTRYLLAHPEMFKIRLIPAPAQIDREDVRLAMDVPEDWEHALAIFDALGSEEFDWQRIATLLDNQPTLRRRMADLNRAQSAG